MNVENSNKELADSIPSSREIICSFQQIKAGSRAEQRKTEEIEAVNADSDLAHTVNEFNAHIRNLILFLNSMHSNNQRMRSNLTFNLITNAIFLSRIQGQSEACIPDLAQECSIPFRKTCRDKVLKDVASHFRNIDVTLI